MVGAQGTPEFYGEGVKELGEVKESQRRDAEYAEKGFEEDGEREYFEAGVSLC